MQNKRNYKIVASDLDGTFLGNDQKISKENLDAVAEMRSLGVDFVPTTGRTLSEIPKEIMDSSDVRYIITSDGAAVWDKVYGKMIITKYIPSDVVKFILDTLSRYTTYQLAHRGGKNHYDKVSHNQVVFDICHVNQYYQDIINNSGIGVDDFQNFVLEAEDIEMFCIFFESKDAICECKRIFLDTGKICVAQSDPYNLEIYFSAAGKGNTLRELADKLGVDISDTIAVGDSTNDCSLLKAAGLGLAVENACDDLKEIANKIICKNSDHSAKFILENFIKVGM